MAEPKNIKIRNTARQVLFFHVDAENAAKARGLKVDGMHLTQDLFCIGESEARPSDPQPEVTVPAWLWKAAKDHSVPQGKAIQGWMDKGTLMEYPAR